MGCAGAEGRRLGAGVAEARRPTASQAEPFPAYRAKSGEPLARLLVEGYALVREAARRTINMRHFDVQVLGGIAMFHRSIVEMQTGEGKTLDRHAADVLARPAGPRMPPGHGQRLSRPTRRRLDGADL